MHIALRATLDSGLEDDGGEEIAGAKVEHVASLLRTEGVASSANILIADERAAIGVETSAEDVVCIDEEDVIGDTGKLVVHTNHFVREHPGVEEVLLLQDSEVRLNRISESVRMWAAEEKSSGEVEGVRKLLSDQGDANGSGRIWKGANVVGTMAESVTLFGIVMDLKSRMAKVWLDPNGSSEIILGPGIC